MVSSKKVLATATVLGGATIAARRAVAKAVDTWDANPDPSDGLPIELRSASDLEIDAADGATLRGHRCGDPEGPTVLMVHGLIESTHFWAPVAHRLADTGHDVVLVDQRGHGRSDRGSAPYRPETLAADLAAWAEQHDLRNATLVGHSMGGLAAMAFASMHRDVARDRFGALVVVASLARPVLPSFGPVERVLAFSDRMAVRPTAGLFQFRRTFGDAPHRSALEATRTGYLSTDKDGRAHAVRMLLDFDLRPHLTQIQLPTKVIAGAKDTLTPLAWNTEIADLIAGAEIEVVDGVGHMIFFEAPDRLTDAIADFAGRAQFAVG